MPGRLERLTAAARNLGPTHARSTVELGRPCDHVSVVDGHDRRFLVTCAGDDGSFSELVLDLRDDSTTTVLRSREGGSLWVFYGRVGRYWLEGVDGSTGHQVVTYKNWHTDEVQYADGAVVGEPHAPRDLDSRDLKALGPRRSEFVVAGSAALARVKSGRGYGIELTARGHRRRIARCKGDCTPVSVSGGLALWRDAADRLQGYVLGSGKHRSWALSNGEFVVGATKTRVYYGRQTSSDFVDYRAFRWRR